jgi:hypothetical protein
LTSLRRGRATLRRRSRSRLGLHGLKQSRQHEWEHTVPKDARAVGPRMSITLRHTAHLDDRSQPPTEPLRGIEGASGQPPTA